MTDQHTDEAAVDAEIFAAAWKAYEQWNERDQPCPNDTIDCAAVAYIAIQHERAQLTAATRRAEQAERMLAEAATSLEALAESCTLRSLRGMDHVPSMRLQQQALGDARRTLTTIRSAASGEQG